MSKLFGFLPQQHIRQAATFDLLLKKGKRVATDCFVGCFLPTSLAYPRLGLIVSKRSCPLAVRRNYYKRKIREYFRVNQHALSGVDMVVLLRSSAENKTDRDQSACLEELFSTLAAQRNGRS